MGTNHQPQHLMLWMLNQVVSCNWLFVVYICTVCGCLCNIAVCSETSEIHLQDYEVLKRINHRNWLAWTCVLLVNTLRMLSCVFHFHCLHAVFNTNFTYLMFWKQLWNLSQISLILCAVFINVRRISWCPFWFFIKSSKLNFWVFCIWLHIALCEKLWH